tara:strand:- start:125538 stop:126956 length:1419 start_codon:yes stop_codon:yes gene_type:complete
MTYQLSSHDCHTILTGNEGKLATLIQRVKISGESSIRIPIGEIAFTSVFNKNMAERFSQFLSAVEITNIVFNKASQAQIRAAVKELRRIDPLYNFNAYDAGRASRRKRTREEAEVTDDEINLNVDDNQARRKVPRGRRNNTVSSTVQFYENLGFSMGSIAREMYHRTTHPESISQGPLLCCGVASLTSQLLAKYPAVFEKISWDLVTNGFSEQLDIPLFLDQAKLRKPGKITVAEIFMNALNNCKPYIGKFGIPYEKLEQMAEFAGKQMGLTRDREHFQSSVLNRLFTIFANMPRQIVNLLGVFGFKVTKETTFFTPMELLKRSLPDNAEETAMINGITYSPQHRDVTDFTAELQDLEQALSAEHHGEHNVLMMLDLEYNNKILKCNAISTVDGLPRLTHYVYVPKFKVDYEAKKVSFDVFTFGEEYHVTESLADFQKGYRGAIISTSNTKDTTEIELTTTASSSYQASSPF